MKSLNIKKVLFIGLFLISSIQINAQDLAYNDNIVNVFENNCQFIENQTVYICNGPCICL